MTADKATDMTDEVRQEGREAARALLDRLRIREHETGSFRSWDESVQAFARHASLLRARIAELEEMLVQIEHAESIQIARHSARAALNGEKQDG